MEKSILNKKIKELLNSSKLNEEEKKDAIRAAKKELMSKTVHSINM